MLSETVRFLCRVTQYYVQYFLQILSDGFSSPSIYFTPLSNKNRYLWYDMTKTAFATNMLATYRISKVSTRIKVKRAPISSFGTDSDVNKLQEISVTESGSLCLVRYHKIVNPSSTVTLSWTNIHDMPSCGKVQLALWHWWVLRCLESDQYKCCNVLRVSIGLCVLVILSWRELYVAAVLRTVTK